MQKLDVSLLEGWLVKKHSNGNKSMFSLSSESKRWFKVREVKGIEETELTLAYYASHRTKEAKGFIYLRDVTMIRAMDDLSITLKSPARIMTICTETPSEHSFWLEGLVHLCTSAEVSTGPNGTDQCVSLYRQACDYFHWIHIILFSCFSFIFNFCPLTPHFFS
jgi:hypothetical protein